MSSSRQVKDDSPKVDNRSTHRRGCDRLIQELRQSGFHVESGPSTRGISIVAIPCSADDSIRTPKVPILVRAASKAYFSIMRRHEKVTNLILAYVWHVRDRSPPVTYAMTYKEALSIAEQMGWTETVSWQRFGWYTNNEPGKRLRGKLASYQATPERWRFLMKVR